MENIKKEFERVSVENNLGLTDIEIEIATWLESGYSQAEIAGKLGISQQAVSKKIRKVRNLVVKTPFGAPFK